ncbi:peptidoglycan DD-metalloendopeptidase family protein [Marinilactibacillus sp. Marseille-P9653]|uniref:peptidoglycan DD-metalloendopeptidase family protein n=1 Tax=Marinilactibacillus sp. Marseille-P9653 TaxID=2866583 RepID=UPI001CE4788D|nr:peptidoglycan DD-metalloendopeptidase family protein [Marinilactibacillus sp. Marseille-P9653]
MKRNWLAASVTALLLLNTNVLFTHSVFAESSLDELQKEKESIEERATEVEGTIDEQDATLSELDQQRASLENDIQNLQISIGELSIGLEEQSAILEETTIQIENLQDEVIVLNHAIEKRNQKLDTQARATQTEWNAGNIIHTIVASENLAEVIGRLNIVNTLVSANQMMLADQVRDQQAVVKAEAQMQFEKEEVTHILYEMERTRAELSSQQTKLDRQINQVVELYQMTTEEKETFVQEQYALALQSADVDGEINAETERIRVEEKLAEEKRLEEERVAAQLLAEKQAEEQLAAEAEAQEQRTQEALARQEAQEKAEQEKTSEKSKVQAQSVDLENEKDTQVKPSTSTNPSLATAEESQQNVELEQKNETKPKQKTEVDPKPEVRPKPEPVIEEKEDVRPSPISSFQLIKPASGYISSGYGVRIHPVTGTRTQHNGIDIAGSGAIIAAASGTVSISSYSSSYGYYIKINHGNGIETLYAHLQPNLLVSAGQTVQQGQRIGTMGTTGVSTGVHLHFEVRVNGQFTNPATYIGL